MKSKLKHILVLTLVMALTSQTMLFSKLNKSNVLNMTPETVYAATEKENLGGFKLISKKWVADLKCNAYEYEHSKSGAKLIFLDNKAEDKMFSVTFRTPAKDDTGITHIIEHSVLQGSKKYPVKDPFIEMSKRSLNTFLNAMTASDHTMYPVSSKNNKDFQNLMSVYLDAVFYPKMITDKRIFEEEGWRYELDSKDGELKYNGIVYNEMKGNYSKPGTILNRTIAQSLFPDTTYKYESGGHPDEIPNLTYEKFVKTYKEYYTPSNSYFYLCGNLDINKTLKFIGENYLNSFDKKEVNTKIQLQEPFTKRKIKTSNYPVAKGTSTEKKTYLSSNYVLDPIKNNDEMLGFSLLQSLLTGMDSSPLSKALKENGFGENASSVLDIEYLQPVFSINVQNTDENKKEKFQKVIDDTLNDIAKNGFDKDLLNSIFNQFELSKRMVKGSVAIAYNNAIMQSWIYDKDPLLYLNLESSLDEFKKKVDKGYLQTLIKKYFINNNHTSLVVLKPKAGLQEVNEAKVKEKLAKIKEGLSNKEINEIIKENKELKKWQETPNSKEDLKTLPSLIREDINTKIKEYKTIEKSIDGIKVLHHPIYTNGVDYINLYFDTTKVPQNELGYLYLLNTVLGNIDTKNYTKEDLSEEMSKNACQVSLLNNTFVKYGNSDVYYPKMVANILSLKEKTPKSFEILKEIIYNSKLNDKARLKEIIDNTKTMYEQTRSISVEGMAEARLFSYMSESGKYKSYADDGFYNFICDLDKNFDSKSDEIVKKLQQVRDIVFNKQDMMASYLGEEKDYSSFSDEFKKFSSNLSDKKLKTYKYTFDNSNVNEGIMTPSKVQYVVKGGDLRKAGYKSSGKLQVLSNILEGGYLWNNIRIKGGAYGASMGINNTSLFFSSFRDPNLKETLNTIDSVPKYLEKFDASEEEMTNYIIGTIGKMDNSSSLMFQLAGPIAEGATADEFYISGLNKEDLERERQEIVSTTVEDIRNLSNVIDKVLKQDYLCVVGGETKIKENKEKFNIIKNIMNPNDEESLEIDMEEKDNISENKEWSVKFSKALNESSVNAQNVYVLDEKNHKVKVNVSYDKANKAIKVEPTDEYKKGGKYTLYIKGIESTKENNKSVKLLAPIKMKFAIKK